MPELPEITLYVEAFRSRVVDQVLEDVRIRSPSLLRTYDPPISDAVGRRVRGTARLGKRLVWELEGELFLVFHLMIGGRFHRKARGTAVPRRHAHGAFDFPDASYLLTERSKEKRASLHVVRGTDELEALDPGGIEPLETTADAFAAAVRRENRTLKRALTDPRILSGIGNAHSDEILHAAGLSPVQRTANLTDDEIERLRSAMVEDLTSWTKRLTDETGDGFPERITAFHPEMSVHGKFGEPCAVCGDPIQRIVYAGRETNYCATCQTGGKLLRDRALSRLLNEDWPRTIEELEDAAADRRAKLAGADDP